VALPRDAAFGTAALHSAGEGPVPRARTTKPGGLESSSP